DRRRNSQRPLFRICASTASVREFDFVDRAYVRFSCQWSHTLSAGARRLNQYPRRRLNWRQASLSLSEAPDAVSSGNGDVQTVAVPTWPRAVLRADAVLPVPLNRQP